MSGNFAIKGGGVESLMANAILNFHFDFLNTSLTLFPNLLLRLVSKKKCNHFVSQKLQPGLYLYAGFHPPLPSWLVLVRGMGHLPSQHCK